MSDPESELTEISDDESDYSASKNKSDRKGKNKDTSYTIRNALKVPRATTYTAQALYDQIHTADVDLEPEYQRDVVWPESKQVGIIDSLLRNFYIPPVIFAVKHHEDGTETRVCIDGKQRLTSIYRFMDGTIAHKDPYTGEKLWYKDDGSQTRTKKKLLPDKYKKVFANKQVVCVEYTDLTDADEREIFQRVQLGMALTPAEKLHAIKSPRADFIRKIHSVYFDGEGPLNSEHIEWEKSRGGGFRCLAQAVLLLQNNSLTIGLTQVEKFLKDTSALSSSVRETWDNTFYTFGKLVIDSASLKGKANVFKHPTKPAPIEMIAITYLIGRHREKMTLSQLTVAIGNLRNTLRGEYQDIRMNSRVWRTAHEFVSNLKANKVSAASGQPIASVVMASLGPSPLAKEEGRDKRKRTNGQSDEEEEEQPPAKSKKQTATAAPSAQMTISAPPTSQVPTPSKAAIKDRIEALRVTRNSAASLALPPISTTPVYAQPPPLTASSQMAPSPMSITPTPGQGIPIPSPASGIPNSSSLETSLLGWTVINPTSQQQTRQSHPLQNLGSQTFSDHDRSNGSSGDKSRERDGYRSRDPRDGRGSYRDDYRDPSGSRARDRDRDDRAPYSYNSGRRR